MRHVATKTMKTFIFLKCETNLNNKHLYIFSPQSIFLINDNYVISYPTINCYYTFRNQIRTCYSDGSTDKSMLDVLCEPLYSNTPLQITETSLVNLSEMM